MRRRSFIQAALAAAAAPGLAQAQSLSPEGAPNQPPLIEPANALERAFIAATDAEAVEADRAAFRRLFVDSRVALVLTGTADDAAPAQIMLPNGQRACLIFTSAARAHQAMQRDAPLAVITGREALTRVRGANVVVNINLRPLLTLDAEGIEGFLALPPANAPAAQTNPPAAAHPPAHNSVVAPGVRAPSN